MCKLHINKVKSKVNFTTIDNTILRDKNISLKAKALLCFILSLPPNWDFSREGLVTCIKEGKTAVDTALKELEKNGYLKITKTRKGGEFYTVYEFYEIPFEQYSAISEKPRKKIRSRKSETENRTQINTNKINTNKKNNIIIYEIEDNIKSKINYKMLIKKHEEYDVNKIVKVIADVLMSDEEDESTKSIFNSLNSYHIEYVLEKAKSNSKNIKNYSAWLKKVMSNVPPERIPRIRESDFTNYIESEDGW